MLVWLTLVAALGARLDAMASSPRILTFEQRLEAQRRIEEVLWARRIWPAANPTPKPPLASVLSEDALRIRVEDGLRRSNALVALRGHALGADELRVELERMVRDSRDPRTLTAMFAALGGDPFLEAEILARPALTERLLRSLYVQDASIGASDATNPRPSYEPWWREHRLEFSPEIAAIDGAIDAVASPETT